jgi:acyl-coenzyme A thioesterase PaaI-like protein
MTILTGIARGACAFALAGVAFAASAQDTLQAGTDATVNPTVARQ